MSGAPLSGSIADWAEQIEKEAEKQSRPKASKKIPERSSAPTKTARGTSMGGAATPRERAAAGLNPVAGLDIDLEDAAALDNSGVTATVWGQQLLTKRYAKLREDTTADVCVIGAGIAGACVNAR